MTATEYLERLCLGVELSRSEFAGYRLAQVRSASLLNGMTFKAN